MNQNSTKKHPLPYFAAFFQGGDYIINIRVDHDKNIKKQGHGYIQDIWIKYKDKHEWHIGLTYPDHWITCSTEDRKCVREFQLNRNHTKYILSLDDLNIIATTKERALSLKFKDNFFINNPNVKEYYGAAVSEKQLRYLKNLKEELI